MEEPNIPAPQAARRQEVLLDSIPHRSRARQSFDPAPRIVAQPENGTNRQAPLLLSIFFTPINILYGIFAKAFRIFSYLFPFLPRLVSRLTSQHPNQRSLPNASGRRPLGPQDTTARFLREFEEEYGLHTLPLLGTGYARAYDQAKQELKFLLVVPLSPEHDDTAVFVRDTLLSESVLSFINDPTNNILVWAGSVQDSEAFQVSTALNINGFPCAALVAHTPASSSNSMAVLSRIHGVDALDSRRFLAKLQATMGQQSEALGHARAARAEQQSSRNLRDQQNSAYERSLAIDRERARQRKEAEAARSRAEKEAKEKLEAADRFSRNTAQWRRWRAKTMAPEPGPDVKDAVRISIRLLNSERVTRRFLPAAQIEELYAFVECCDLMSSSSSLGTEDLSEKNSAVEKPAGFEHKYGFRLVSPMPREVFDVAGGGSVREKIGRSGSLVVEKLAEADEDDGDGDEE